MARPTTVSPRALRRALVAIGAGVSALAIVATLGAAVVTVLFARTVITPPRRRPDDLRVIRFDAETITLGATIDSMTPGRYGMFFAGDAGYARIGEIVSFTDTTVTRQLLAVPLGSLEGVLGGRFSGWFYLSPADLDVPYDDVQIETDLGDAPAWLVPAAEPTERWVIQVHGRAVRRQETLRAIPVFRDAGYTSLLISYRNDGDAPDSADNRYGLGETEWRDVEAAMRFAADAGAREIVLMGWSMGGATVLQTVTRSELATLVTGIVLDSPVVDWITTLQYQGAAHHLPSPIRHSVLGLLSQEWAGALTGQAEPLDLARLDLVARADDLTVPVLLLHSDDDGFVPPTASHALAEARPDIVTYERFTTARHVKLWNYDPDRWTAAVSRWLAKLPAHPSD